MNEKANLEVMVTNLINQVVALEKRVTELEVQIDNENAKQN